jgi:hypothetical protein
MRIKMKQYSERCDDGISHSIRNKNLGNKPVCSNGKWLVKTRFRQKESQ